MLNGLILPGELYREGSVPAACAAGLFIILSSEVTSWTLRKKCTIETIQFQMKAYVHGER